MTKYLLAFIIYLTSGCQAPNENIDSQLVIEEVKKMLDQYHVAINQQGLEAEFDFLDHSDAFFWVPPGYTEAIDFDSVAAVLRKNDPGIAETLLQWDTLKVIPLRNDLAQYYGIIRLQSTDTAGVVTSGTYVETGMVIRRQDRWKLLNGQSAFFEKF